MKFIFVLVYRLSHQVQIDTIIPNTLQKSTKLLRYPEATTCAMCIAGIAIDNDIHPLSIIYVLANSRAQQFLDVGVVILKPPPQNFAPDTRTLGRTGSWVDLADASFIFCSFLF